MCLSVSVCLCLCLCICVYLSVSICVCLSLCLCLHLSLHMNVDVHGGQKREWALQTVVSHQMWVLGTKLGPGTGVYALNLGVISPTPTILLLIMTWKTLLKQWENKAEIKPLLWGHMVSLTNLHAYLLLLFLAITFIITIVTESISKSRESLEMLHCEIPRTDEFSSWRFV